MANEFHPGGAYTRGTAAQEENIARRTQLHHTFVEGVVEKVKKNRYQYTEEWTNLISGAQGRVYLSEKPLICIRGYEQMDKDDLGYELYDDSDIYPFLELRSAAVDCRPGRSPADMDTDQ